MMKYFPMIGSINEELLIKFIDFANNNAEAKWIITINSHGGASAIGDVIIKMINDHASGCEIIAIRCLSCAFQIFFNVKGKKYLTLFSVGMWHYNIWSLDFNDKGEPHYDEDKANQKNMSACKTDSELLAQKIMNPKEFNLFKKSDNIYFHYDRLKEIFPDSELI